ncbi:hypothetical protein JCM15908A_01280 [Prevotella dentasini JCM 15908]
MFFRESPLLFMERYICFAKAIIMISLKCNYGFPRKFVAFYEKVYMFYKIYNYKSEIYNYDFTKM